LIFQGANPIFNVGSLSYAYKALDEVFKYVSVKYGKDSFFYEANIRNIASTKLLRKFEDQYEIIEQGFEKLITDSGKKLELQGYILKVKKKELI